MTNSNSFTYEQLKSIVDTGMEQVFNSVPFAREFHVGDGFDAAYYKRHIIELVLRIQENNVLDAVAISKIAAKDPLTAKDFSYYLYDELGHDKMFFADLKNMGISQEDAESVDLFFSTKVLMGYLHFAIRKDNAIPAIMWDWFLEYYSEKYNGFITSKAERHLGISCAKGAKAHVLTDKTEDHPALMFKLVRKIVKTERDEQVAREYLARCVELVGMYFRELHAATIEQPRN